METTDHDVDRARVQEEEVETRRPSFYETMPVGGAADCWFVDFGTLSSDWPARYIQQIISVLTHYNPHDRVLLCFHGNTVQTCTTLA